MTRQVPRGALAMALVVLLTAAGPTRADGGLEPARTLDEVNRALRGHRATIEFVDGSCIERARQVEMGPATTTFRTHGRPQRIATQQIHRVSTGSGDGPAWARHLFWILIAALVGGVIVVFDEDTDIASDQPDFTGGGDGDEPGARLDRRPARVVYEAPPAGDRTDTRPASRGRGGGPAAVTVPMSPRAAPPPAAADGRRRR